MKKLACWKAKWISLAGRLTLVKAILSALPAYQLVALIHPKWLIKQIDKLRRAFLWASDTKVAGGKCLVNLKVCCLPKQLGGLGIPDLHLQNIALRVRWLWQQDTNITKPWLGLPLPIDPAVHHLYRASTTIHIHDGRSRPFWHSHWLEGWPLKLRFPALYKHSRRRDIMVREALTSKFWITLIKACPTRNVLSEYLLLWRLLDTLPPFTFGEEQDTTTWNLTTNGVYTAKSAYFALMFGRIESPIFSELRDTKAIPKCKVHSWLLFHNKCLTADNLAKRGWPHNALCPFCKSSHETTVHLHIGCPYAQDCWKEILNKCNLPLSLTPQAASENTQACWVEMTRSAPTQLIRRWRSLALLT